MTDYAVHHSAASQSNWSLSCAVSNELSEVLATSEVHIIFQSEKSGVITVDGEVAFEVMLEEPKLIEPFGLNEEQRELTHLGPVLKRCTIMSIGAGVRGVSSGCGVGEGLETKAYRTSKLDLQTVKKLSAETSHQKRPSVSRGCAEQVVRLVQQRRRQQGNPRKKVKRASATSSVVLRGIPVTTSAGQIGQFFAGLDVVDIFSVPNHLEMNVSEDGCTATFKGTSDVFVLFGSDVSAGLAEKRSGEPLDRLRLKAVNPTVEIVGQLEWNMSKGVGVQLRLSSKSVTTCSAFESLFAYGSTVFRNDNDKEEFFRLLLQRENVPRVLKLCKESLEGLLWSPEVIFDSLLAAKINVATLGGSGRGKRKRKLDQSQSQGIQLYKDPLRVPARWNPVEIVGSFLLPAANLPLSTLHNREDEEDLIQSLRSIVAQIQHLKAVALISGTTCLSSADYDLTGIHSDPQTKPEAELGHLLSRMHSWYSGLLCMSWRREIDGTMSD